MMYRKNATICCTYAIPCCATNIRPINNNPRIEVKTNTNFAKFFFFFYYSSEVATDEHEKTMIELPEKRSRIYYFLCVALASIWTCQQYLWIWIHNNYFQYAYTYWKAGFEHEIELSRRSSDDETRRRNEIYSLLMIRISSKVTFFFYSSLCCSFVWSSSDRRATHIQRKMWKQMNYLRR